jgi:hypothetical protein
MDDILDFDRREVFTVEGAPDGISTFHFAAVEGRLTTIGVLVLLGEERA